MRGELNYRFKNAAVDAQNAAEESRYYQNKAHSTRWRCRIGKLVAFSKEEKVFLDYEKRVWAATQAGLGTSEPMPDEYMTWAIHRRRPVLPRQRDFNGLRMA